MLKFIFNFAARIVSGQTALKKRTGQEKYFILNEVSFGYIRLSDE
jgi:hypothetical protein